MERRDPELAQRLAVIDGRVAAVVLPAVTGVLRRELLHEAVAGDLRDDRRGGDRERLRVALDYLGGLARRESRIEDAPPVDEDPVVLTDLTQRSHHGDVTRVIDVEAMDLGERRGTDPYLHHPAADRIEEPLTLETRKHLRVVHFADE